MYPSRSISQKCHGFTFPHLHITGVTHRITRPVFFKGKLHIGIRQRRRHTIFSTGIKEENITSIVVGTQHRNAEKILHPPHNEVSWGRFHNIFMTWLMCFTVETPASKLCIIIKISFLFCKKLLRKWSPDVRTTGWSSTQAGLIGAILHYLVVSNGEAAFPVVISRWACGFLHTDPKEGSGSLVEEVAAL